MTCLRSHPHEPEEACDGSVRHLYAKGAHDERERIFDLIESGPFILCNCNGVEIEGEELRAFLAPKP